MEEEDIDDILDRFEDDVRVFPATTDAENMDAHLEDAPAHDAKDTTSADYPYDMLSDPEESTTSDEDDENSIYTEVDSEGFLSPEYDVLDDQVSADPSTTPSKDKASGGMLHFGPVPVAAELSDELEVQVPSGDLGEAEADTVDTGDNAVDDIEGNAVNDMKGDAAVTAQEEVEGGEVDTVFDTDSTGDSDMPFDTIASDYEDLTESSSDSDDDGVRAGDGYLSDAFNWYDDYSDYDATDTDESSDDMLYLNEGELSDLPDTSDSDDEYDTDSSSTDDEDLAPDDVEVAGSEAVAVDEAATVEAESVDEVPQVEEANPEATS